MLDTETFYQSFDAAGFLKTATWTPSGGLVQPDVKVRYQAHGEDVLSGEAISNKYTIRYPATRLIGMKRGDQVVIEAVQYTVREQPRLLKNGSELEAELRKGA